MLDRQYVWILIGVVVALFLVTPVSAGNWVTVTVDTVPREVHAGETEQIGFTIRQHGQRPINLTDPAPSLSAYNSDTGETIDVAARQNGPTGHYVVDVTFASAGVWEWRIVPTPFPVVTLEPLTVLPPAPARALFDVPSLWMIAGFGMLLAAGLVVSVRRGRIDRAPAVVVAAIGLAIVLVVVYVTRTAPASRAAPAEPARNANYGQALFVAKGCAGCHRHAAVDAAWSAGVGPNLTHYEPASTFVRMWLRDPRSIRPKTVMPDLELNDEEIDALIAFLNDNAE